MRCVDRAGDLHEIEGKERIDVRSGEDVLVRVAVAVEAVMVIFGRRARCHFSCWYLCRCHALNQCRTILSIGGVPTRVVYKLAVVVAAGVEASCIVWVVATVAAAVVSGAIAVIARRLAVMVLRVLLWPIYGACGFAIGLESPFLMLKMSAYSFVRQLLGLASVASGGLGDGVAMNGVGGGVSSWTSGVGDDDDDGGEDSIDEGGSSVGERGYGDGDDDGRGDVGEVGVGGGDGGIDEGSSDERGDGEGS